MINRYLPIRPFKGKYKYRVVLNAHVINKKNYFKQKGYYSKLKKWCKANLSYSFRFNKSKNVIYLSHYKDCRSLKLHLITQTCTKREGRKKPHLRIEMLDSFTKV